MKTETSIALPVQNGYLMVATEDIVRCQAHGNYTHIFLMDGREVQLCKRLKEVEELLPAEEFYRVHHSHLVNLRHVKMWVRDHGNFLDMAGGGTAPVARLKIRGLKERLKLR